MFAHHDEHVAVVRKAPVDGYEFSGKWAFPGGLVRGKDATDLRAATTDSIKSRANSESGLVLNELQFPFGNWEQICPITRYSVRGSEKFTLVVPAVAALKANQALRGNDKSIVEVGWIHASHLRTLDFAPANAVIAQMLVTHVFGDRFSYPRPQPELSICKKNKELVFSETLGDDSV